jgi:hypothetical protein
MRYPPFDLLHCSWPRPVEQKDGYWTSEPEWDAPSLPLPPQPRWRTLCGETCWTIDWREFFRHGLELGNPRVSGEMRGFHVVSQLRANRTGRLVFWDDDGSLIRRNGELVHVDRSSHGLSCAAIDVAAGDELAVAHWQQSGAWLWGARMDESAPDPVGMLLPYLDAVQRRLQHPTGPALKLYCSGALPARTVLAVYSLILNGYAPSEVLVFGEHQWPQASRDFFARALPFAQTVPTWEVMHRLRATRLRPLEDWAARYWFVFKACLGLFCPPHEFCLIDDDVFILDRLDDALSAFRKCDLVFTPDADHSTDYTAAWGPRRRWPQPLPTGRFNAGLYWMRGAFDPRALALAMLRVSPHRTYPWVWEQGFIASVFAGGRVHELPSQRYFYPLFDGLPGGLLGYDYANNPCGFTSIHFGGLSDKPSDAAALELAAGILNRIAPLVPLRKNSYAAS